jgi:hypothetical protein
MSGWVLLPPAAAAMPDPADAIVAQVHAAVRQRDCAAAVKHLNEGLAARHASVRKLAGAMFEDGICVKANRERAIDFYQRAFEGGETSAGARLVALHAAAGAQQDPAATLWWAQRVPTPLPPACSVTGDDAADPDRYVAALQRWPAGQLGRCVYAAGVMAGIVGELEADDLARQTLVTGTLRLRFEPSRGRVDVVMNEVTGFQVSKTQPVDTMWDAGTAVVKPKDDPSAQVDLRQQARQRFEAGVRAVIERALKRHPRPEGIDGSWRSEALFVLPQPHS